MLQQLLPALPKLACSMQHIAYLVLLLLPSIQLPAQYMQSAAGFSMQDREYTTQWVLQAQQCGTVCPLLATLLLVLLLAACTRLAMCLMPARMLCIRQLIRHIQRQIRLKLRTAGGPRKSPVKQQQLILGLMLKPYLSSSQQPQQMRRCPVWCFPH
jgi:hypothetical protein